MIIHFSCSSQIESIAHVVGTEKHGASDKVLVVIAIEDKRVGLGRFSSEYLEYYLNEFTFLFKRRVVPQKYRGKPFCRLLKTLYM